MQSRRNFLASGAAAGAAAWVVPSVMLATPRVPAVRARSHHTQCHPHGHPPDAIDMHALARRAIEAATAAGAAYADVRVTHTVTEKYGHNVNGYRAVEYAERQYRGTFTEKLQRPQRIQGVREEIFRPMMYREGPTLAEITLVMGIGVRAFYNGYWGFASSPYWETDDAARLGREAAAQAKTNAAASAPRDAQLATAPVVSNGSWVTPGLDPFTVPVDEKIDVLQTLLELPYQADRRMSVWLPGNGILEDAPSLELWREQRVFASTEGTKTTQTRFRTLLPHYLIGQQASQQGEYQRDYVEEDFPQLGLGGWDVVRRINMGELAARMIERSKHPGLQPRIAARTLDVGKYDVVFDASVMAELLAKTLGSATQLDRVLGFEANATGTSYLGSKPLDLLGTPVAAPSVTVTANRTDPAGWATTQWDDEGVPTQEFPLVKDGTLVDFQTTREQAGWLNAWYQRRGTPAVSRACSNAATALDFPIQMTPNLTLAPGADSVKLEDLIKDTTRGIYFPAGSISVDMQAKNGEVHIAFQRTTNVGAKEIRNGRIVSNCTLATALFTSAELWKNIIAIGGAQSARSVPVGETKGQPRQEGVCTATAVPVKVKDVAILNT